MYKRKIINKLQEWKQDPHHKPIVVKGVRQCGKTTSVRYFAEQNYQEVVYLDFRTHPDYKQIFSPNLDVSSIITRMSAVPELQQYSFTPHTTCFLFDEIQDCPMARASLNGFLVDCILMLMPRYATYPLYTKRAA